ncbi:MAG: hypothetical protein CVU77_02305 [Elusimicrobia bacterium HGW-Elusimicrobia-1]|jgi:hypothetical protein|nr:MAG: hypothetical protein CVU77_02305 [Elusimicrobia bacterium HGW-Elusimicrobia-1]
MSVSAKKITILFAVAAIALAALSFMASGLPDGLEAVAEHFGFAGMAAESIKSPAPGYVFPSIADEKTSGILAGFFGAAMVFALSALGFRLAAGKKRPR